MCYGSFIELIGRDSHRDCIVDIIECFELLISFINAVKQHAIMNLGDNYFTTLPTEFAMLTRLQSGSMAYNYLDCAEVQKYFPEFLSTDY